MPDDVPGELRGSLDIPTYHLHLLEERYEVEVTIFRIQLTIHLSLDEVPNICIHMELHPGRLCKYECGMYLDPTDVIFFNSFTSETFETAYEFVGLAPRWSVSDQVRLQNPAVEAEEEAEQEDEENEEDAPE